MGANTADDIKERSDGELRSKDVRHHAKKRIDDNGTNSPRKRATLANSSCDNETNMNLSAEDQLMMIVQVQLLDEMCAEDREPVETENLPNIIMRCKWNNKTSIKLNSNWEVGWRTATGCSQTCRFKVQRVIDDLSSFNSFSLARVDVDYVDGN